MGRTWIKELRISNVFGWGADDQLLQAVRMGGTFDMQHLFHLFGPRFYVFWLAILCFALFRNITISTLQNPQSFNRYVSVKNNPAKYQNPIQLKVPYHAQLDYNSCGEASLLMVLDYWGKENSLQKVVEYAKNVGEAGAYDPACDKNPVCTSSGALVDVASKDYGMMVVSHEGWTQEQVRTSLANGRPIIAGIHYELKKGGFGHFVVIYGFDVEQQQIYYHDPLDGPNQDASWNNFFYIGWNNLKDPVDVKDPLQTRGHVGEGIATFPR